MRLSRSQGCRNRRSHRTTLTPPGTVIDPKAPSRAEGGNRCLGFRRAGVQSRHLRLYTPLHGVAEPEYGEAPVLFIYGY